MIVYQVYSNEEISDGDGWFHWIDKIPLSGTNLYFKRPRFGINELTII